MEVETAGTIGPAAIVLRPDRLILYAGFEKYTFYTYQVVSFTKKANRVQIHHTVFKYPAGMFFHDLNIIAQVRHIGFIPSADSREIPLREGIAIRWQAIVLGVFLWNLLLLAPKLVEYFAVPIPEQFSKILQLENGFAITILFIFLISIFIRYIPFLQSLIFKPGRCFGEMAGVFNLLVVLSTFFIIYFGLTALDLPSPYLAVLFVMPVLSILFWPYLRVVLSEELNLRIG